VVNHRENSVNRRTAFPLIAILVVVAVLAYSNTFRVGFTFDDLRVITENPAIKHLSNPKEFWNYWSTRWLVLLSLALNYRIHGLRVPGYHIVNLAIHVLNGIVLFYLVRRLLRSKSLEGKPFLRYDREIAFFSALLFLAHPVQTEAVTYIVQRTTSLATLLYLTALLLYVAARQSKDRSRATFSYVLCIAATAAGMLTKEITITIPLCIVLYVVVLENESPRQIVRRWRHFLPVLLTLLIIPTTLLLSQARTMLEFSDPQRAALRLPLHDYLLTEVNVVRTYLRLLFVPAGQNLDWEYPAARSLLEPRTFLSLMLLLAIVAGAIWLRKRNALVCFGILWFFLSLSVESSFLPLYNVIAEHRLYLPMAGFSIALVAGLYSIAADRFNILAAAALSVFIVILAVATHERNRIWQEGRIWEDVVKKSPQSARAHNNLGNWYKSQGRLDDAIHEYTRALELDPSYFGAYTNLGLTYDQKGRMEEAVRCYARALTINPHDAQAYNNLGIAYGKLGLLDRAIEIFHDGLQFAPDDSNLRSNLGLAYLKKGDPQSAVVELERAMQLNPDNEKARENLRLAREALAKTHKRQD
jgi:Flp pilus assembly protein TadD